MMQFKSICRRLLPVVLMLLMTAACHACPTCKDGIAEGGRQANMVRGFFWSIVFMMSMPFLIFGGLGAYFYYQVRQARAAQSLLASGGRPDLANSSIVQGSVTSGSTP